MSARTVKSRRKVHALPSPLTIFREVRRFTKES